MVSGESISVGIDQFKLEVVQAEVFPVYWINTPDYAAGFRAAKATPEEMQAEVDRIVQHCESVDENINVRDAGSARNFLYRNQIGLDCSAFVYHLVDRVLLADGRESLQHSLFVPRNSVISAASKDSWHDEHELTRSEAAELPEMVPLDWVCDTFKKEPVFQTNVARLCSAESSDGIEDLRSVVPGDLVYMTKSGKSKHVAIVTQVDGNEWEVWDSYREDDGYGGIMPHRVQITDPNAVLQDQKWTNFDKSRYDEFSVRRLKALS